MSRENRALPFVPIARQRGHFEIAMTAMKSTSRGSRQRRQSRPVIIALLAFSVICSTSGPSLSTATFCAVTEKTADGFVTVRDGPGTQYKSLGKLEPSNLLWVATEQCRSDFGPSLCDASGQWVFVERVFRVVPSPHAQLKGWANIRLIRQVACEERD